jgi:HSP20 family protein
MATKEAVKASSKETSIKPAYKQGTTLSQTRAKPVSPFEDFERPFEHLFPQNWFKGLRSEWPTWQPNLNTLYNNFPRVDIVERDKEIIIRAELAGVDKKDIDVSINDSTVTIKGSTKKEVTEENDDYYRCELTQGNFSRTLTLPCEVKADECVATFKNGILELKAPKTAANKRRHVDIS